MSASYDSNSFWAVTARWRYFEGVDYDGALTGTGLREPTQSLRDNVSGSESYLDINATFRFLGDSELLVGINNVLDEEPPLVGGTLSSNANAIAGFYDTLGQYLFAQAPSASKETAAPSSRCCVNRSGLYARFFLALLK